MAEKKYNNKTLVLTLGSLSEKGGKKKKKNPGINPGQSHLKYTEADSTIHSELAGKGRKKKENKKNPGINLGQPAEKGRKKKNPGITLGSPSEKGGKKKRKKKTLVLTLGNTI
jgi:hypothetical protein